MKPRICLQFTLCMAVTAALLEHVCGAEPGRLQYNRDVRPILADKCFSCHGPDANARKADLRLDLRESAVAEHDGGRPIVPGRADQSQIVSRIQSADDDEKMPPSKSNLRLSAVEIDVLRRWIAEGAEYQPHWSFIPPKAGPVPDVRNAKWPRNEIDHFVLAALEAKNLHPAAAAGKETLLRRLSFDLAGLPPTLEELDAFLADATPDARERAVDRLLSSKHFGERMAVDWLDAARYADTNGYFGDKTRMMWLWRDWVIDAFNRNMPFDQFTIEQLAGDLLPGASTSQKIATGFNRNHMANNESGIIDEEYRVEYVLDRLDTTATTWLGLTVGCAQCHDHKFDPISQKEFYELFAFFNNGPETGLITNDNSPPLMSVPSADQRLEMKRLEENRLRVEKSFAPMKELLNQRLVVWQKEAVESLPKPEGDSLIAHYDFEERLTSNGAKGGSAHTIGTTLAYESGLMGMAAKFDATQHAEADLGGAFDADKPWTISVWMNADCSLACVLSKIEPVGDRRGLEVIWQKGRLQINLVQQWSVNGIEVVTDEPMSGKRWHHLLLSYDGKRKAKGLSVYIDGLPASVSVQRDTLNGSIANHEPLRIGRRDSGLGFYGMLDELRLLQRAVEPAEVRGWFWGERLRGIISGKKRSSSDQELLLGYYVDHHADSTTRTAFQDVQSAKRAEQTLRDSIPTTLIMQEMDKPRVTAVLMRGEYDKPGEEVQPATPAAISPWPEGAPRNRLGLAQWLVSPANPLTARVMVNRLWQQCFGEGLVRTMNDFGAQGEQPTHPELLDWLAVRFMKSGWDVKAMLKLIVMSATYRQSSGFAISGSRSDDPENRLLSRGPSFRLSAEMLRDEALAVSELLVPRIGGPSVKPYQPPGLWEAVSYNGEETYTPDSGDGLWRRSLYTFIKRQAPPPSLLMFDGPTREKCTVRRARTNTPLQALLLLNDETYVEAARVLAARVLREADPNDEARLTQMFRRVTSRLPASEEISTLRGLLGRQTVRFSRDRRAAEQLIAVGKSAHGRDLDPVLLATWTVLAQTLFNLDETIALR
jgi:Protein of unknown function (DUF1553)/Protein of unknown function (DUF1549)/Planctomycete cytochrome C/Concanavalin A-like lectin/glucanases superfamily